MNPNEQQSFNQQELLNSVSEHLAQKYGKRRRVFSLLSAFSVTIVFAALAILLVRYKEEVDRTNDLTVALESNVFKQKSADIALDTVNSTLSHINGFLNKDAQTNIQGTLIGHQESVKLRDINKSLKKIVYAQKIALKNKKKRLLNQQLLIHGLKRKIAIANNELDVTCDSLKALTAKNEAIIYSHNLLVVQQESTANQLASYKSWFMASQKEKQMGIMDSRQEERMGTMDSKTKMGKGRKMSTGSKSDSKGKM